MGLLGWLFRLIFRPPKRDISRLDSVGEEDVDAVAEDVDLSGGPLKEGHRRRALRDRRLLPKRKRVLPFRVGKRKPIMPASEADRLFSATMRTRNRNIRDLLPDEEQLARYGLPVWRTEEDLAAALGLTVGQLRFFSIHREMEKAPHYVAFAIPKRSGKKRLIMAPKKRMKALLRKLHDLLVSRLPVSDCAHGFRRGRSIRTGAEPHVGKQVVLRMDIRDFFPTVHFGRVRGLLIALGYGYPVATALAVMMTEAERQPVEIDGALYHAPVTPRYCVQGAPTSPGLCNSVALRLDRRLAGLAKSLGFAYTRYADDLAFSGDDPSALDRLRALAALTVREEGFEINAEKTCVMRRGRRQSVTGVTVNDQLGLSRKERRRIRAMAHQLKRRAQGGSPDPGGENRLKGKLAYLNMLNPAQASALRGEEESGQPSPISRR